MKDILLNILASIVIISSILVITSKNPIISVLYLISVFINTAAYLILLGIGFIGIGYIIVYIGAITVLFLFVIMMINIKLVDILEVGKDYTKNLPLALLIGFVFLYLILSISTLSTSYPINDIGLSWVMPNHVNIILDPISLKFITYPLEILTNLNRIFMHTLIGDTINTSNNLSNINSLNLISTDFINSTNSLINPINFDGDIVNFLQIEMLGQGLYTYGAAWLILSSIVLLLAMVSPIILTYNRETTTQ